MNLRLMVSYLHLASFIGLFPGFVNEDRDCFTNVDKVACEDVSRKKKLFTKNPNPSFQALTQWFPPFLCSCIT